jgi:hypothetical protein
MHNGDPDVTFATTGSEFQRDKRHVPSSAFTLDGLVDNVPGSLMDATIWEFVGNITFSSPRLIRGDARCHDQTVVHVAGANFADHDHGIVYRRGQQQRTIYTDLYRVL